MERENEAPFNFDDDEMTVCSVEEIAAATKIQALWRGHWARWKDPYTLSQKRELRSRRMEEHVLVLRSEVKKCQQLYEQERQLRVLQLEALKQLWKEVGAIEANQ